VQLLALLVTFHPAAAQTPCLGDCNGNAMVAINELILGVSISLGRSPLAGCPAFDLGGDGSVEINELIGAVRSSLNGCPIVDTPPPTELPTTVMPTATSIVIPTVTPTATPAVPPASGVIELRVFTSDNGTLYYVIGVDVGAGSRGIGAQITSVAMSDGAVQAVEEPLAPPDRVLTAFSGAISGSAVPQTRLRRTDILRGLGSNDVVLDNPPQPSNGEFDPAANGGRGLLVLPGGLRTVGVDGSGTEAVHSADAASGSATAFVPAAATANLRRQFRNNTIRAEALVFPSPAGSILVSAASTCSQGNPVPCDPSVPPAMQVPCGGTACEFAGGEVSGQSVTVDDTLDTRIGNATAQGSQVDGFFLRSDVDLIVFIVEAEGRPAPLNAAAAGFLVVGSCAGGDNDDRPCSSVAECPGGLCNDAVRARLVAGTVGGIGIQVMPPPPPTPTATPGPDLAIEVAYVANFGANTVSVIDTQRGEVITEIPVGKGPFDIALTPGGDTAYISLAEDDAVEVIDTATSAVIDTLPVDADPRGIALTPNGDHLLVVSQDAGTLKVIDRASGSSESVPLNADGAFDVVARGGRAYVTRTSGGISVVDLSNPSNPTLVAPIALPEDGAYGAYGLIASEDGRYLFGTQVPAVGSGPGALFVVDAMTGEFVATLTVDSRPGAVALRPPGSEVYVANTASNTISIVDVAKLIEEPASALLQTLTLPREAIGPSAIAFTSDGSRAFVTNRTTGNTAIVDARQRSVERFVALVAVAAPEAIVIGRVPLKATATPTPTSTRTATQTASATATATVTDTWTPIPTPSETFTATSTATATGTGTVTKTFTVTATATSTSTRTVTYTCTATFTRSDTPTLSPTPTRTPVMCCESPAGFCIGAPPLPSPQAPNFQPCLDAGGSLVSNAACILDGCRTFTATGTFTLTPLATSTRTPTPTSTQTPLGTVTSTATVTRTVRRSPTPTQTLIPCTFEAPCPALATPLVCVDNVCVTPTHTPTPPISCSLGDPPPLRTCPPHTPAFVCFENRCVAPTPTPTGTPPTPTPTPTPTYGCGGETT
jgi:YVTN family beta-propeller protein